MFVYMVLFDVDDLFEDVFVFLLIGVVGLFEVSIRF